MAYKLDNYLKTYRKRAGLTQDELAFLLGDANGTKISRLEKSLRQPDFQTALACQIFFGVSAKEIFPSIFAKVERQVLKRAHLLSRKLNKPHRNRTVDYKLKVLQSKVSGEESGPKKIYES